jgi:hypothetical protein
MQTPPLPWSASAAGDQQDPVLVGLTLAWMGIEGGVAGDAAMVSGSAGCSGSDSTAASRRRPASSWSARWRRRPRRDQRRRPCPHRGNGHPRAGPRAWLSAASAPGSDHRPGRKHALQRTVGRRHGHAGYRRLGRHRGTPGLGRTVVRLHVTVTSGQIKAQSDRGLRCHRQSGRPLRYHRPENHPASRQVRTARSGPARRRYAQPAPSKR